MSSFIGKTFNKLVNSTKTSSSQQQQQQQQQLQNQDIQLTLTHLRKVFYEYLHPRTSVPHEQQQHQDNKLYSILPLFLRAFNQNQSLNDIKEKFYEIDKFCDECSRLLVNEISRKSNDDLILVKYFEIKSTNDDVSSQDGYCLLQVMHLLSCGPSFLIDIITQSTLPSRLVMCTFLFICLPEPKDSLLELHQFNASERRLLFFKLFNQTLLKLCSYTIVATHLCESDSLKHLFNIIISNVDTYNSCWRLLAGECLCVLAKNLSIDNITFLSQQEYLTKTLEAIDEKSVLNSQEKIEIIQILVSILKSTSKQSPMLIDDFSFNGYRIITDICLSLEEQDSHESVVKIIQLLEELVFIGFYDLKINSNLKSDTMFQLMDFRLPQPQGRGKTIRNTTAFQCLLNIFNKLKSFELSSFILDSIKSIYKRDEANYFVLESQNVLLYNMDDFSIKIHFKPRELQFKFIDIIEYIIYTLKFVPCKELVSIGLAIQNSNCIEWSIVCAQFLNKLVKSNKLFQDVYRELGLFEIIISCLHKFAALLKENLTSDMDTNARDLGYLIMDITSACLAHNSNNAKFFCKFGGPRLAHNMVPYKLCRTQSLQIITSLLLSTASEDDLATLMGLMQTAQLDDLDLKNSILKCLLSTLRESHRTRTAFRKVGGFVYIVSVLISMDGCLATPPKEPWNNVTRSSVYTIIKTVLNTLTISMRYEPANAKFFDAEVKWSSLISALKLLGCFKQVNEFEEVKSTHFTKRNFDIFEKLLCSLDDKIIEQHGLDENLLHICHIMRYLFDTAIDSFDKPFGRFNESQDISTRSTANMLDEPLIIHPGAITSMLYLSACIESSNNAEMEKRLQYQIINLIKNLLRYERNQQIMANSQFIDHLLIVCKNVLNDETHFLNASIQYIFERLASHCLTSNNLREYFRFGTCLDTQCKFDCLSLSCSSLVPLNRVKCLISMTTPRESTSYLNMPFIEFNMNTEGFGCIFVPSICPQLLTPSIVTMGMVTVGSESSLNGGLSATGGGERIFPSQSGLSFSTWLYIDRCSNSSHPIRLLMLINQPHNKDMFTTCLSIYLTPKNRSLIVSTEEQTYLKGQTQLPFYDEPKTNEYTTKFNSAELFREGEWLHLCVILTRAMIKNSTASLYINSNHISTNKLHYINACSTNTTTSTPSSIHAIVGTLPCMRQQSNIIWRQGGCYLFEDILSLSSVQMIYSLGPGYIGSLQAPSLDNIETPLNINEERILFGMHTSNCIETTLNSFKKTYNKYDTKVIAKQLAISSKDESTPIRILLNTSTYLNGPSRSIGGALIGYLGVRIFQPKSIIKSIENVGGITFILGLIAQSNDVEFMYASVKALVCLLKINKDSCKEMDHISGYNVLSMIFKRKKHLINSHILNLTFELVSTQDSAINMKAFECLIAELDIWYEAPSDLQKSLHDHLNDLLQTESNFMLFQKINMFKRFLLLLKHNPQFSDSTIKCVLVTLRILMLESNDMNENILKLGRFMATLLPNSSKDDNEYDIKLRNMFLMMLEDIISHTNQKSILFQEEFQRCLGYDWFMLFMLKNTHRSSVLLSSKILFKLLLLNNQNLQRFKESQYYGTWLSQSQTISNNEENLYPCFQLLQILFAQHVNIVELYYFLFALLFDCNKLKDLPHGSITLDLDLNSICKYVFNKAFDSEQSLFSKINQELSIDISSVLLIMIRSLMNQEPSQVNNDYAIILLQIFRFMYHNCDDFRSIASHTDFLQPLILTLYPYEELSLSQISRPMANEIKSFAEGISDSSGKYSTFLTMHPARKLVMDFLRDLLLDSLMCLNIKTSLLLDNIFMCLPGDCLKRNQEFVTEIFKCLVAHLSSSDLYQSNDQFYSILNNIYSFVDRLVHKLWDTTYKQDSNEVLDLVVKIINIIKKKCSSSNSTIIEQFLSEMNRLILYQLSRPTQLLTEQIAMLDALHKMLNLKTLIFSPLNSQPEFFACVAHCLLVITDHDYSESDTKTEWYIPLNNQSNKNDAKYLLTNAAQRVWLDLYLSKKSLLEEGLKINLNLIGKSPTLDELRLTMSEAAAKVWLCFIQNGDKRLPERIQSHLTQKFQRVTGGISNIMSGTMTRVVTLKKPKKELPKLSHTILNEAISTLGTNLNEFQNSYANDVKKFMRLNEQNCVFYHEEWIKMERDLLRERALWGNDLPSELTKYKLDFTEGPNRMRKRLITNDEFYSHYPYRSCVDLLKPNKKYKIPSSFDSKLYAEKYHLNSLLNPDLNHLPLKHANDTSGTIDSSSLDGGVFESDTDEISQFNKILPLRKQIEFDLEDEDIGILKSNQSETQDTDTIHLTPASTSQSIARLLEEGEKINLTYRCARVQGLETNEGVFLFGKEHFYILDGFTIMSSKDIVDIDSLKSGTYEPLIPKSTSSSSDTILKLCNKFAYEDIKEVHKRRYLLQPIALEIFSNDGRNYLIVFPRKCRNKVYDRLIALTPDLNDSAKDSIAGQKRSINIEQSTGILNALIGERSVTQRWEKGEISNFQYLMFLNTLAGRSYNDLMQYPIFPWILADYDSHELDLLNPNTFRDLSKPMGAQTHERLKQFQKRYQEWDDPSGETPPYHYGTHYSSAMIVASYLVRMEPFAQTFLRLQGGHFDLADRMFHSIKDNWLSASKNNMADVKELIPEFFYLPEFLINSNKFDLGRKQNGVILGDVLLPTWAKQDAHEFIRVHRLALESDYVSAHLNEWIDLIFGYKQHGSHAVESNNVYHHLFYEGAVDIDDINDPLKRNAIIGFINNFGQIPKQLFKKPHPTKKLNSQFLYGLPDRSSSCFYHHLNSLKPSFNPIRELRAPVGQILSNDKGLLIVEQNKILLAPNYQRYLAWGFPDESIKIGYTDYEKSFITFENIQDGKILTCCSPDGKMIVTAGESCVINIWELSVQKQRRIHLKRRLYGHTDTITCLALSNAYHMLISGSNDCTCIIWDLNNFNFVRQLPRHITTISCICINDLTGNIATASSNHLYVWSINGELLASINTCIVARNHTILCICFSQMNEWDKDNVVLTGDTNGIVRMWSLDYKQVSIDDETRQVSSSSPPKKRNSTSPRKEASSFKEDDDDFVLVNEEDVFDKSKGKLKDGHKWVRELTFRTKLTLHTSFERKDNNQPAKVTSLALSKDHKQVFVGDSLGRVFSWTLSEQPGKQRADHWVKEELVDACKACNMKFTFSERKHHCRHCGFVYCNSCSKYDIEILKLNITKPVRVCLMCYQLIKADTIESSKNF